MQKIASVLRSDGTDGRILLGFQGVSPDEIDLEEPVFIYDDGLPVPYFISEFTRRGSSKAICRLTGVRSLEDAEELVGRDVCAEVELDEDDPAAFGHFVPLYITQKTGDGETDFVNAKLEFKLSTEVDPYYRQFYALEGYSDYSAESFRAALNALPEDTTVNFYFRIKGSSAAGYGLLPGAYAYESAKTPVQSNWGADGMYHSN